MATRQRICHDAFYFLADKKFVATEMMRVGARVLVGHMHNSQVDNLSSGAPITPQEFASLFPSSVLFDDTELTSSLLEARVPRGTCVADLCGAAAIALAWPGQPPGIASGRLTTSRRGMPLRRNPLYVDGQVVWPSKRYEHEYGALASYPATSDAPNFAVAGEDEAVDAMALRRVLLDLPHRW